MTTKPFAHLADTVKADWDEGTRTVYEAACEAFKDERYTYNVNWSAEDQEYVATVDQLPSLSWLADDPAQALSGIRSLVADVLADVAHNGE